MKFSEGTYVKIRERKDIQRVKEKRNREKIDKQIELEDERVKA